MAGAAGGVRGARHDRGILISVAAVSASDIWSVGTFFPAGSNSRFTPLGEHWNGTTWRVNSPPSVGGTGAYYDVATRSHSDVWAVGGTASFAAHFHTVAIAAHWNGTAWQSGAPKTPGRRSVLDSVAAIPSTARFWAVGDTLPTSGRVFRILIERHC